MKFKFILIKLIPNITKGYHKKKFISFKGAIFFWVKKKKPDLRKDLIFVSKFRVGKRKKKNDISIFYKNSQKKINFVLDQIVPMFMNPLLSQGKKKKLLEMIKLNLKKTKFSTKILRKTYAIIEPFALHSNYEIKNRIIDVLKIMKDSFCAKNIVMAIKKDFEIGEKKNRCLDLKIFTIVTIFNKTSIFLPILRMYCLKNNTEIQKIGVCKLIQKILIDGNNISRSNIKNIIWIIGKLIINPTKKIFRMAGLVIPLLINVSKKKKIAEMSYLIPFVFQTLKTVNGKNQVVFLGAFGHLIRYFKKKMPRQFILKIFKFTVVLLKKKSLSARYDYQYLCKILLICKSLSRISLPKYAFLLVKKILLKTYFQKKKETMVSVMNLIVNLCKKTGFKKIFCFFQKVFKKKKLENKYIMLLCLEKVLTKEKTQKIDFALFSKFFAFLIFELKKASKFFLEKKERIIFKQIHRIIEIIFNKFPLLTKKFLSRIAGLLKWEIKNNNPIIREAAFKTLSKVCTVFKKNNECNLIMHLFLILFENIKEKEPKVLSKIFVALNRIIKIFFSKLYILPLNEVVTVLIPLLKIPQISTGTNLINLIMTICSKNSNFLPRKDWYCLCLGLLEILEKNKSKNKKNSISCLCKIGKIIGPLELIQILVDYSFQKKKKNFCQTSLTLSMVGYTIGCQLVFARLFSCFYKSDYSIKLCILRTFSYMLEILPIVKIENCLQVLNYFLEKIFTENFTQAPEIFLILLGQFLGMSENMEPGEKTKKFLKTLWIEIFFIKKNNLKLIIFVFRQLEFTSHEKTFFQFLIPGIFHPIKKIRYIYWNFTSLIGKKLGHTIFFNCLFSLKRSLCGKLII